ncbi:MAG: hypothetical protein HZB86_11360 [Deltaproteobacteria bacterium]|nr:hypothetical protein [Deltaproteobacteria bacterium]
MALRLIEMGYGKVFALKGGWDEWVRREHPVVRNIVEPPDAPGKAEEIAK